MSFYNHSTLNQILGSETTKIMQTKGQRTAGTKEVKLILENRTVRYISH